MNKPEKISVWRNTFRKKDEEPHYRGKVTIGNSTYSLSLWINDEIAEVPINMSGQAIEDEKV